jgi:hypothetical protein
MKRKYSLNGTSDAGDLSAENIFELLFSELKLNTHESQRLIFSRIKLNNLKWMFQGITCTD